jgi:hypothetical protein
MMLNQRLIFACFAAAILLSMVREWNTPVSCPRGNFLLSAAATFPRH